MRRLLAMLLLLIVTTSPAFAVQESPRQAVERLNAGLLEIMKNAEALGYQGRLKQFASLLDETYNLAAMARAAVGRQWEALSGPQRRRLVDAFTRMTRATYASRFDGYSGERFEVMGDEPGVQDLVLVKSRLIKTDGESVALDYMTKDFDGQWRIVDVYYDGKYSELARLRAEFGSVLRREGLEGLIAKIEAKITRAASGGG